MSTDQSRHLNLFMFSIFSAFQVGMLISLATCKSEKASWVGMKGELAAPLEWK